MCGDDKLAAVVRRQQNRTSSALLAIQYVWRHFVFNVENTARRYAYLPTRDTSVKQPSKQCMSSCEVIVRCVRRPHSTAAVEYTRRYCRTPKRGIHTATSSAAVLCAFGILHFADALWCLVVPPTTACYGSAIAFGLMLCRDHRWVGKRLYIVRILGISRSLVYAQIHSCDAPRFTRPRHAHVLTTSRLSWLLEYSTSVISIALLYVPSARTMYSQ